MSFNFDFHSWAGTDAGDGRSFDARAASASTGIVATSAAIFQVRNEKEAREARRARWRNDVKPLDHSEYQRLYDACWRMPETVDVFPAYSFLIRLKLNLASPLLTKDDQEYYAIDNAVRKDRTFGVPYLSASSWKGCFRAALARIGHGPDSDITVRLCGNRRGEEDHGKLRRGRLEFFATPFERLGFEVLNPHARRSKTGKPIYYECVPAGTPGDFCLLYVPFDGFAGEVNDLVRHVSSDLPVVANALAEMLLATGFGAKVSSGFGTAREDVQGTMLLRAVLPPDVSPASAKTPPLPGYMIAPGQLRAEFLNPDGTFRRREPGTVNKRELQQYEKALRWYERERATPKAREVPAANRVEFEREVVSKVSDVGTVAARWRDKLKRQLPERP